MNGVRSAKAAGMNVIAIATPFTDAGLHANQIVPCVISYASGSFPVNEQELELPMRGVWLCDDPA